MPNVPARDFAKLGVITDISAFDLPLASFNYSLNARFEDGAITRSPVFRRVRDFGGDGVRHMTSYADGNSQIRTLVVGDDGRVYLWTPSGETDLTIADYTPQTSIASTTTTISNGVVYINREDRQPWWRAKDAAGTFETMSSYNSGDGMKRFQVDWRFKSLRSVAGLMIGINVTEGPINYPNMVRWSDYTEHSLPPRNWDDGDPRSDGGFNLLADLNGYLIDGQPMGNSMILFGDRESYRMDFVGGNDVFAFRPLYKQGVINVNCTIDVNGVIYVFGDNEIYRTDGNTMQSIATGRVRKHIYNTLVRTMSHRCFVVHNEKLNEIMFCFPSNARNARFPIGAPWNNDGCNLAAVYNYASDTWYFYDLPYVTSATRAPITAQLAFDDAVQTYDDIGGSYASLGGDTADAVVMGSTAFVNPREGAVSIPAAIRSYEPYDGTSSTGDIDVVATAPVLLLRERMDLDDLKASLRGYKLLSAIIPQARFSEDAAPMTFVVGISDHPDIEPVFAPSQTFSRDYYKLDYNAAGRYLTLRIEYDDFRNFTLSGMDFDITSLGQR